MSLDGTVVNHIAIGGFEVLRSVYVSVRDEDWETIPVRLVKQAVLQRDTGFEIHLVAEHVAGDVNLMWKGSVIGKANCLRVAWDAVARSAFHANRISLCLLHPVTLAGRPLTVTTREGAVAGWFPPEISPHQPFRGIVGFQFQWREADCRVALDGGLFEMEDQRNWSDASYKTYSPPLNDPIPIRVEKGQRFRQSVTLDWDPMRVPQLARTPSPGTSELDHALDVRVGIGDGTALPSIGVSSADPGSPLSTEEVRALRLLHLAHLRVVVDLRLPTWRGGLVADLANAAALGVPAELEVVADDGEGFAELAASLGSARVARVLVFSGAEHVTTLALLRGLRDALRTARISAACGGGSRAHFAEFNRASLPVSEMEVAGYPVTPQLHVFDHESLAETLAVQASMVEQARSRVGTMPVSVGPVTLLPRYNSTARSPAATWAIASGSDAAVDARQNSLFVAGWTLGSLSALARGGAAAVTYFETTGRRGLMQRPRAVNGEDPEAGLPELYPVWQVLSLIADLGDARMLSVVLANPATTPALALVAGSREVVLVANLSPDEREIWVAMPGAQAVSAYVLDVVPEPAHQGAAWYASRLETSRQAGYGRETHGLVLPPCTIGEIRGVRV
ncbi:MAG: hypothetical protein ABSC16_12190 [Candidatus Dormibacteria bacterium]